MFFIPLYIQTEAEAELLSAKTIQVNAINRVSVVGDSQPIDINMVDKTIEINPE